MAEAAPYVQVLAFDAHPSHQFVRRCLAGQTSIIDQERLKKIPCFGKLQQRPMPEHGLPRLPVNIVCYEGDPIWGLPGPCAWDPVKRSSVFFLPFALVMSNCTELNRGSTHGVCSLDVGSCSPMHLHPQRPCLQERRGPVVFPNPDSLLRELCR